MNRLRARQHIEQEEERRYKAYYDSKGILSVGVGFNLEEPSAVGRIEALGVDYDALRAGKVLLNDAQIDVLFDLTLDDAESDAKHHVPNFTEHPEDVQLAVLDMNFNMGGPRFSKFVNLRDALKEKNYHAAATHMADSKWAKEDVPRRASRDIALVRGSA
jgi:GH24 family phage-related lysozyme (muramidase)